MKNWFYDVLFETIDLGQDVVGLPDKARPSVEYRRLFPELAASYEMSRLLFVNQAGVNFLEFPSATHNRFSHSLGAWHIGVMALQSVQVRRKTAFDREPVYRSLLDKLGSDKAAEFLVALLLHDCGHGPFSHVLESNPHLHLDHKSITGELIRGEGSYAEEVRKRAAEADGMRTVASIINDYKLDSDFIAALTSASDNEFADKFSEHLGAKQLLDSKVDIDRIDHYLRDSRVMGIRLVELNIRALLASLVIFPGEDEPIRVREEGIPHVLSALQCWQAIWTSALDSPNVRCYEAILNRAITLLVQGGEVTEQDLALGTDSDLLRWLSTSKNDMVRELSYRLLRRQPYHYLGRAMTPENVARPEVESRLDSIISDAELGKHDLLCHVPFARKTKRSSPWLRIHTMDGQAIDEKYPWFTQALFDTEDQLKRTIRFYAKNVDDGERVVELVQAHFHNFEKA